MFHGVLTRMCILLLLGGMFYKCLLDPLIDDVAEFLYILADFLCSCSINC